MTRTKSVEDTAEDATRDCAAWTGHRVCRGLRTQDLCIWNSVLLFMLALPKLFAKRFKLPALCGIL